MTRVGDSVLCYDFSPYAEYLFACRVASWLAASCAWSTLMSSGSMAM